MRRTILAAALTAAAIPGLHRSAGAADLERVRADRPSYLVSNGDDEVAFGRRGSGRLVVIDTVRGRRTRLAVPRGCGAASSQDQRAFAGDRVLLRCVRPHRQVIVDVRTGETTPAPTALSGVDIQTASSGSSGCTGSTVPRAVKAADPQPITGCAAPGNLGVRSFEAPYRFDFSGRWIVVRRCGGGAVRVEHRVKAYRPVSGTRRRWVVPGRRRDDAFAVHTADRVFVADVVAETEFSDPVRLRIFRGKL